MERRQKRERESRERGGAGELSYPPHQEKRKVEEQALPFRTWHHLCRQEVEPSGSPQLREQNLAPVQRCVTEGKAGRQGREGANGDGNRDGVGTGTRTSTGMSTRAGMGPRTGAGTGTRIERQVEGRDSLETYKVVIEVGRKTRGRGVKIL